MRASKLCAWLIKRYESLRLEAYKCPAGKWTIGWGHTHKVTEGQVIDEHTAEMMFLSDLNEAQMIVKRHIVVPLNQHQYDALVSLTFNIGEGHLEHSTLKKKLNAADYDAVPDQIKRWKYITVDGVLVESNGLLRRRFLEAQMWAGEAVET